MIIADQWRGQDQGWAGNPDVTTSWTDALAAAGVAVPRAVANHPVCGPSRADLLTGLWPHQHRVVANDLELADDIPTIADALQGSGYRTGLIGKWHLDRPPRDRGVPAGRGGFEWFAGTNCTLGFFDRHFYTGDDLQRVETSGYEPVVQTDLALQRLKDRDPDGRPDFLVLSYGPPHDPYDQVPDEHLSRYCPDQLTLRANTEDTAENRLRQARYYAAITAVDEQIGRLVDDLDRRDRLANTLLIVTSDHGDMLGAHGRRAKQVPYAEAVRVPLVLHWPDGLAPHRPHRGVFGLVDLAPTILDLIGSEPLPAGYGQSRAAALAGRQPLPDHALLGNTVSFDQGWLQGVPEWRGFVSDDQTYARKVDGAGWMLFDDAADPWQLRNLIDDDAAADRIAAADAILDDLLAEAGDEATDAESTLRRLGLVSDWNERERAVAGDGARLLEDV